MISIGICILLYYPMSAQTHINQQAHRSSSSALTVSGSRGMSLPAVPAFQPLRQKEQGEEIETPPGSVMDTHQPLQRKVDVGNRTLTEKSLTDGSAFKRRLTKQMDKRAKELNLTREDIRKEIVTLIKRNKQYTFTDSPALMEKITQIAGDTSYLTFGLDGRNREQIENAVESGYTKFDCAQSYDNTADLAAVLDESDLNRDDLEITYKFDLATAESPEDLKSRLLGIAASFGGYLNNLIIHNLDATPPVIKRAWKALHELKLTGAVDAVGLGNLDMGHVHLIEELQKEGSVDVVENSVSSMLEDPDVLKMIARIAGKVLYYDVVKTARDIGVNSVDGIKTLAAAMAGQLPKRKTRMILSSGNTDRIKSNLENFEGNLPEYDAESDEAIEIFYYQKQKSVAEANGPAVVLTDEVRTDLNRFIDGSNAVRTQIKDAADEGGVTREHILGWLDENTDISTAVQDSLTVPARIGLKKRYVGMPLGNILVSLFGNATCDWKWSIELLQLLITDLDLWADVKESMPEITG